MKWIVEEAQKAKERNDMVVIMAHHAHLPHFELQDKFLSPYIIDEWNTRFEDEDERINGKTPYEILADMDVKFLFTGHLHANDIAKYENPETGKVFYDIQTGATLTYPLPVRHITFVNNIDSENPRVSADISTELIDEFTYTDPATGQPVHVKDATKYADENNELSPYLVANLATGFVDGYVEGGIDNFKIKDALFDFLKDKGIDLPKQGYGDILVELIGNLGILPEEPVKISRYEINLSVDDVKYTEKYGSGKKIALKVNDISLMIRGQKLEETIDNILNQADQKILKTDKIRGWLDELVTGLVSYQVYKDEDNPTNNKTVMDLANISYKTYLRGNENQPDFVREVVEKYSNPERDLLAEMIDYAGDTINKVFSDILSQVEFRLAEDDSNPEDASKNFVKNILELDSTKEPRGLLYNGIATYVSSKIGNNLNDTFNKFGENIGSAIGLEEGQKAKPVDLVKFALSTETVQGLLTKLSNSLGADSVTDLAVTVVDAMTKEDTEGYDYFFHPDGDALLVHTVSAAPRIEEEEPEPEPEPEPVEPEPEPVEPEPEPVEPEPEPVEPEPSEEPEEETPEEPQPQPAPEIEVEDQPVAEEDTPAIRIDLNEDSNDQVEVEIRVNKTTVQAGEDLRIELEGAIPELEYDIFINGIKVGTLKVNADGSAEITISIPEDFADGLYDLEIVLDGEVVASIQIRVQEGRLVA